MNMYKERNCLDKTMKHNQSNETDATMKLRRSKSIKIV